VGTPKQKERNERMYRAALAEFSAHGFQQANVDTMALNAGVSKATFYSHFGTKEALFLSVFEKVLYQAFKLPDKPVKAMSLEAKVRMNMRKLLKSIAATSETRFFFQCMASNSEVIRFDLRSELTERFTATILGRTHEMQKAQEDGLIYSHLDLKIVQQAIVGFLLQTLQFWFNQGKNISIKYLSDQITNLLLFGMACPALKKPKTSTPTTCIPKKLPSKKPVKQQPSW